MYSIYTLDLVMVECFWYMTWSWLGDYGHDLVIMALSYMITCMFGNVMVGWFGYKTWSWVGDYGNVMIG